METKRPKPFHSDILETFMNKIKKGDTFPMYEKGGKFYFQKNAPQGAKSYTPNVDDFVPLANALTNAVEHNIPLEPSTINALAGKVSDAFKQQYEHFATQHSQLSGIGYSDFVTQHARPGGDYYELGKKFLSQVLNTDVDVSKLAQVKIGRGAGARSLADFVPGFRDEAGNIVTTMKLKDLRNTVSESLMGPVASAASISGIKGYDPGQFMSAANLGILEAFPSYERYRFDASGKRIEQSFISHAFTSGRAQVTQDYRTERNESKADELYFEATHHGDFSDAGISIYDPGSAQLSINAINRVNRGLVGGVNNQNAIDILRRKIGNSPLAQAADPAYLNKGLNSILNILRADYGNDSLMEVVQTIETDGMNIPGLGHVGGNPVPYERTAIKNDRPWYWNTIESLPKGTSIPTSLHYDPNERSASPNWFYPYKDGKRVNPNSQQVQVTRTELENFYSNFENWETGQQNLPEERRFRNKFMMERKSKYDEILRRFNKSQSGADRPLPDVPGNIEQWSIMDLEIKNSSEPEYLDIVKDDSILEINVGKRLLQSMHKDKFIELSPAELNSLNGMSVTLDDVRSIASRHTLRGLLDQEVMTAQKNINYAKKWGATASTSHDIIYPAAQRAAYFEALEGGLQGGYTNELAVKMLVNGQRSLGKKSYIELAKQHGVKGSHDAFYRALTKLAREEELIPPTEGTRNQRVLTTAEVAAQLDASAPPPPEDPYSIRNSRGVPATLSSGGGGNQEPPRNPPVAGGFADDPSDDGSDVGNQEGDNMIPGYDFDDLSIPEGSKWQREYHSKVPYRGQSEYTSIMRDGRIFWSDKYGKEFEHGAAGQGYYGRIVNPDGEVIWQRSQADFDAIYQQATGNEFNPIKSSGDANQNSVRRRGVHRARSRKNAVSNDFSPIVNELRETNNLLRSVFSYGQGGRQSAASMEGTPEQWEAEMNAGIGAGNQPGERYDRVQARINAVKEARRYDPLNPLINTHNPLGIPENDRERELLWRRRNSFTSLKNLSASGGTMPLRNAQERHPDYRAFEELQSSFQAYEAWQAEVGPEEVGNVNTTQAAFIRNKAAQWADIKSSVGSIDGQTMRHLPQSMDDMRAKIIAFDPSAENDPAKMQRYYRMYASVVGETGINKSDTDLNLAAHGYTSGWTNDDRRGVRIDENGEIHPRPLRDQYPERVAKLRENMGMMRSGALSTIKTSALEGFMGVPGIAELDYDAQGNEIARLVNSEGAELLSPQSVEQAKLLAHEAFSTATDTSLPMPADTRDAMATIKSRMNTYVNEQIKAIESGMKKHGFTDAEIKSHTNKLKSVYEAFADRATKSFETSLTAGLDDKEYQSYKDKSFAQYKNVPVSHADAVRLTKEDPAFAEHIQNVTGKSLVELAEAPAETIVSMPERGNAYKFAGTEGGYTPRQPRQSMFGQGNTRSLLYGAMMMRYSWMMAAEPTLRQSMEFGEGMAPVGMAAAVGQSDYNALGGVGGFKSRQSLYKQYMGQGAYEVYGGFAETPGLLGGGQGWYPRMASYFGPAAGVVGGSLAVGGSMGMFGTMNGMGGLAAVGKYLPYVGAAIGGGMLATGIGMEIYNQFNPDKEPMSIGTVYRNTLQDFQFAKSFSEYDKQRADEIIANSESGQSFISRKAMPNPGEGFVTGAAAPLAYGINQAVSHHNQMVEQARYEWENNPEYKRHTILNDPIGAAALSVTGMTPEEEKIQKYATTLGEQSGEGFEGGIKGVLSLAGFVGADRLEQFFSPENFNEIANIAKKTGMSAEDVIKAAGESAGSFGVRRGTDAFSRHMLDFIGQQPDITDMERLLDKASKRTQYGGQLQYMMGHGELYSGLGEKLFEQYQPVTQEVQYAQQIASSIQRYGSLSPTGWSQVMQMATGSNAMQISAISSVLSSPGLGDFMGGGANTPDMLAKFGLDLSGVGMNDQQAYILDRAAAGDLKATSFYGHQTGNPNFTQYYDKFGHFAGRHDGMVAYNLFDKLLNNPGQGYANWRAMYGSDFANINTSDPTAFAASITGSDNPEIQQAFLSQGMYGMQLLSQRRSAENSLASAGIAMAGVNLQRDYLWGSGSWDKPAEGSMYYLEDRMRALQHGSQMEGFKDQWTRLQLTNQYAGESERIQETRMYASHAFNDWNQSFNYNLQLRQRGWQQQDWGYQDQMRSLNQGWQMEDLDEAIRFSSGRERRQLVRQKERMAISTNLEDEQIGEQRDRQKELWAAEDERYQKNMDYQKEMQQLDVENFELGKRQRQEFYQLDVESFERRKSEYLEQKEIQDEIIEKQREHQAKQLELQAASAGLQAKAAADQLELLDAMTKTGEEIDKVENSVGLMQQYDLAYRNMEMLQSTIGILNNMAVEKVTATGHLFSQIDAMNIQKLRSLRDMLIQLISIGE